MNKNAKQNKLLNIFCIVYLKAQHCTLSSKKPIRFQNKIIINVFAISICLEFVYLLNMICAEIISVNLIHGTSYNM